MIPPVIFLDFAGRPPVFSAVHERFGDDLALSLIVGGTHVEAFEAPTGTAGLPRPTQTGIFGPAVEAERIEQVGVAAYATDKLEGEFVAAARHCLRVHDQGGSDVITRMLTDAFSGRLDSDVTQVLHSNG